MESRWVYSKKKGTIINIDNYDIIIVGGGIMGSSTAHNLMKADNTLTRKKNQVDPEKTVAQVICDLNRITNRRIYCLKKNW